MNALIIRNAALEKMAYVDEIESIAIIEGINREYELQAALLVDEDKAQYITSDAILEIENNYFRVRSLEKQRWAAGQKRIGIQAEHVSYDLINYDLEYFTATGTPRTILNTLLAGTGFTVGDVEISGSFTVSIQEETNKRQVLLECARVFSGELEFDKFTIHLRQRRGEDSGVQIRLGKNLKAINRIEEEVDGQVWTAYEIDLVELVELYGPVEEIRLGDTIRLIDEEMGIDADHRVVWYSYDPRQKRVSRIQVANFVANLTDTLFGIKNEALQKEKLYNGIRIGPEHGFVATRSDKQVRTTMNATEGISIELGPGDGSFPNRVFYVGLDNGQPKLFLAGDAIFQGEVRAGKITAETDIDITRNARIGNFIFLGREGTTFEGEKGIIFDDSRRIYYDLYGFHITAPQIISINATGASGSVRIIANVFDLANADIVEGFKADEIRVDNIQGLSDRNVIYFGNTGPSVDMTGGIVRWRRTQSDYIRQTADAVTFYFGGSAVHSFGADGSKTGGSIEIDGKRWGMSPIDSPKVIIEDLLFDVVIEGETKVELDEKYAKAVEKYAVFPSHPAVVVIEKQDGFFVAHSDEKVICDFSIKGIRIGYGDTNWTDMEEVK